MNSKKKGDIGLGTAIAYFTSKGNCVNIPLTDSQEYDLVVDLNGNLNRVQVKYCTYKDRYGYPTVGISVRGGSRGSYHTEFDPNSVELLFVETPESCYLIPSTAFKSRKNLGLSPKYDKYKLA